MPNLFKKLTLIVLSSVLFLNSMAMPFAVAKAQDEAPSTWYKQDFGTWYSKVYGDESPSSEIFGERYTAAQVEWIFYGIFSFILNHVANQDTAAACIAGQQDQCVEAIKNAIQKLQELSNANAPQNTESLSSLIFKNRPVSGIRYIKDSVSKFSITDTVYAQSSGFGFSALKPVQQMWSISRNFAYSISVLMIVIFAFMIMFRVKMSPQLVISVQSALPKVIFALVLATFSYAIAGLMIDLMYVVIGLLSLFLGQFIGNTEKIFILMTEGAPVVGGGFLGLMAMYSVLFFWVLLFNLFASGNIIVNVVLSPIILSLFLILIIVVAIVLIFMFFKILWLLLKTLTQTFILVIFAPLQIMLGTVIQGLGFSQWIRSLAGNLAVYPVVGTLFVLAYIFLFFSIKLGFGNLLGSDTFDGLIGTILGSAGLMVEADWSPPLTLGESYIPLIFVGVSFVMLSLVPKAAEIIQGFISGKPFAYGSAIGESVTGPFASTLKIGTAISQIGNAYSTRFGFDKGNRSQEKATNLNDDRKAPKNYGKMGAQ